MMYSNASDLRIAFSFPGPNADEIDYKAFCAQIETIFQTPNLEKDPLIQPDTYKPDKTVSQNCLPSDVAKKVDGAVGKIAKIVC